MATEVIAVPSFEFLRLTEVQSVPPSGETQERVLPKNNKNKNTIQ